MTFSQFISPKFDSQVACGLGLGAELLCENVTLVDTCKFK